MGINNYTCGNCGGKNEDGDVFCRYCGERIPNKKEIQRKQEKQKRQLSIASIFLAIVFVVSIVLFVIDYTNNRKTKESSTAESSFLNDDSYETYSLGDIKFRIPDTYTDGEITYGYLSEGRNFYMFSITGDDALSILDTVKQK